MANPLNGRLDLTTSTPVDGQPTQWDITAAFFDATGYFSASDILVHDIIYSDASLLGLGTLRFRIISIDPGTTGATLVCRIQWGLSDAQPEGYGPYDYPMCGTMALVGRANSLGTITVSPMSTNLIDEAFMASVRSIETLRLSEFLAISNPSLLTSTPVTLQPELPTPDENNEILVGNTDRNFTWTPVVDLGEFPI